MAFKFIGITVFLFLETRIRGKHLSSPDIGANLTDPMYQGLYHGSRKHDPDLPDVLDRALKHGLLKMIVTGGSLEDSQKALELAKTKGSCSKYMFSS